MHSHQMDKSIGTTPVSVIKLVPTTPQCEKLIMDSLLFQVEELHVDGFRFDLAGILGEPDLNYNAPSDPASTVLQDIIDHPVMKENNIASSLSLGRLLDLDRVLVGFQLPQTILPLHGANECPLPRLVAFFCQQLQLGRLCWKF